MRFHLSVPAIFQVQYSWNGSINIGCLMLGELTWQCTVYIKLIPRYFVICETRDGATSHCAIFICLYASETWNKPYPWRRIIISTAQLFSVIMTLFAAYKRLNEMALLSVVVLTDIWVIHSRLIELTRSSGKNVLWISSMKRFSSRSEDIRNYKLINIQCISSVLYLCLLNMKSNFVGLY